MLAALALPTPSDSLYELPTRDAATYAITSALLLAVSLGAAAVPALGATRPYVVRSCAKNGRDARAQRGADWYLSSACTSTQNTSPSVVPSQPCVS